MRFRRPKLRIKTAAAMALLVMAVVAASISVPPSSTVLAQSSGICDRTEEVRDAILAKLSKVSECANVTDSHLSGITGDLILSNKSISVLKAGDFLGLTILEQLYLNKTKPERPARRHLRGPREPRHPVAELQSGVSIQPHDDAGAGGLELGGGQGGRGRALRHGNHAVRRRRHTVLDDGHSRGEAASRARQSASRPATRAGYRPPTCR